MAVPGWPLRCLQNCIGQVTSEIRPGYRLARCGQRLISHDVQVSTSPQTLASAPVEAQPALTLTQMLIEPFGQ